MAEMLLDLLMWACAFLVALIWFVSEWQRRK